MLQGCKADLWRVENHEDFHWRRQPCLRGWETSVISRGLWASGTWDISGPNIRPQDAGSIPTSDTGTDTSITLTTWSTKTLVWTIKMKLLFPRLWVVLSSHLALQFRRDLMIPPIGTQRCPSRNSIARQSRVCQAYCQPYFLRVLLHYNDVPGCSLVYKLTFWASDRTHCRLMFKWKFDNGAAFFLPCCGLLRHMWAGSGIPKLLCYCRWNKMRLRKHTTSLLLLSYLLTHIIERKSKIFGWDQTKLIHQW
jgi:hypothetical protein